MSETDPVNPYPLILPDSLVLGQLVASIGSFIKGAAWELGERFDAILSHRYGDNWLVETYGDYRPPNLHDPDFVFDWHDRESVLWEALPPFTVDLQDRFGKARRTRNRWEHEANKQNISTFLNGVDQINRLAEPLGLQVKAYAPDLVARIRTLQRAGGVLPPSDLELQIEAEREAAEEARRVAQEAADQAAAAVAAAEAQGAAAAEALEARGEALQRVAEARVEIERLEAELQAAARSTRRAVIEPADSLHPGDPWGDVPLGVRVLTLKRNMIDLMDTATQTLLSQQIGGVAHEAARRWLELMPTGGTVHLTPAGHAAGQVGGRFIYLGRIDT